MKPATENGSAGSSADSGHRRASHSSEGLARTALLLVLALAGLFALAYLIDSHASSRQPLPANESVVDENAQESHLGPWGEIICRTILIEPTVESLPQDAVPKTDPTWFFQAASPQDVSAILEKSGVTDPLRSAITGSLSAVFGGFIVVPTADLVIDMSPTLRAALYGTLAQWQQNPQAKPFRIVPSQVDQWLEGGLAPETKALVRKLLYPKDPFLLFSDSALVLRKIPSPEEQTRFLQIVYRQRAILPKLRIRPDSDTEALIRYWGAHGRESRVRPLIESIKRAGGGEIDVALLLPPFASGRLYSYQMDADTHFRDCTWSTMNFFLDSPDDRFFDPAFMQQVSDRDYKPAEGGRMFGDMIVLWDPDTRQARHSCNYIAGDIVFTKNGGSRFRPWVLMHLKDVVDYYSLNGPLQETAFRLKN